MSARFVFDVAAAEAGIAARKARALSPVSRPEDTRRDGREAWSVQQDLTLSRCEEINNPAPNASAPMPEPSLSQLSQLSPGAPASCPADLEDAFEERAALFRKELPAAALGYAAKGYPVFPAFIFGSRKQLLVKSGKGQDGHPDLRKRRATTDPDTINAWWDRWPLAMIGMPTGRQSGVVVLDVDRKNGVDGLANLRDVGIDPFKLTPVVAQTPSGGSRLLRCTTA
ncbi:MAG: bifunctional DNA primase/polymerase [Pikeienuella sp.]